MRNPIDVPDTIPAKDIRKYATDSLSELASQQRPFKQNNSVSLNKIEIL